MWSPCSTAAWPQFGPWTWLDSWAPHLWSGVAADGNGFFHPLGDHAQVGFMIDGQPISDQQSKVFSTQLPMSAVQGMELTTGTPNAEFGDKTSLVAQVTTRSGLGAGRWFGNLDASYGSFGTPGGGIGLGYGIARSSTSSASGVHSRLGSPSTSVLAKIAQGSTVFRKQAIDLFCEHYTVIIGGAGRNRTDE